MEKIGMEVICNFWNHIHILEASQAPAIFEADDFHEEQEQISAIIAELVSARKQITDEELLNPLDADDCI